MILANTHTHTWQARQTTNLIIFIHHSEDSGEEVVAVQVDLLDELERVIGSQPCPIDLLHLQLHPLRSFFVEFLEIEGGDVVRRDRKAREACAVVPFLDDLLRVDEVGVE